MAARGGTMRQTFICPVVLAVAVFASPHAAYAHGIAGNRFFVGTLTFDDPAVADESVLPAYSTFNHPAEGGNVTDNRINWSFVRLLTPTEMARAARDWVANQIGFQ